eukprot:GEMP01053895.1.p1 GENE.GEMP01053895.1~~GEMP01053895.1.p1  ORF type:complete len:402 (+),score=107.62 GEMP01053895.1:96-1301(+)
MSANRFVVFCGNLPYTCDAERLKKFFKPIVADEAHVTPRLLTNKDSGAFRGCAFVEFSDGNEFKKALKLHHSMMDGRKVRIELTSGGGGKGEVRQQKIKDKQKKLQKERREDFKKVKSGDVTTKKDKKKKKPENKEPEADARVPGLVAKFKLNDDGSEYLKRQPPWLIDQIDKDFRLPEEEVRDVTGLLIKFSQGAKKKAYETWSADDWANSNKENKAASNEEKDATKDGSAPSAMKKKKTHKVTSSAAPTEEIEKRKISETAQTKTEDGSALHTERISVPMKKKKKHRDTSSAAPTEDGAKTMLGGTAETRRADDGSGTQPAERISLPMKKKKIHNQQNVPETTCTASSSGVTVPVEGRNMPMKKKRARTETMDASLTDAQEVASTAPAKKRKKMMRDSV